MSAAAVRTVHVNRVPVTSSAKAPPPPIPVRRIHSLPDRTVSEQSQLDDILTDLLNDPLFVDGSKTFEFSNDADGTYGTISANYGSITTAHSPRRGRQQLPGFGQSPTGGGTISSGGSGGGRTVVSWQTNHTGPKRTVTVSRQTVNRPIGESAVEFTSMKKVEAESSARPPSPPVRRRLVSAPDSSASLQQHTTSSSSTWREEKRVQAGRRQQQQQPWRHPTDVSHSDTEDYFRSSTSGGGRRWPKPSYEDPYLSDDMAPYFNQLQHSTSRSATSSRTGRPSAVPPKARVFDLESPSPSTVTYETKRSFFISGIERPANTTRQTKYTFSVSPQRSIVDDDVDAVNQHHGLQKPPPIPPQPRALSPNLPPFPVLPPLRGNSSREAVLRVHATRDQTSSQWENGHSRSPSLDDLEKSLQSVQLLLDTQQTAVKQKPPEPAPVDEMVSLVQRQPNQQSQPPVEIEEEIISLRPIGPGVQNLEPEDPSRFRSMTPAFPTQQRVVSPFPTSPTASQSQQFLGYSATSPADVRPPTNLSPQSPVTPAAVPVSRPPASTPAANEPNVANDIDAFAALMDMEATSTPVIQQQQQSAPQRPDQLQPQRVERNFSSPQQSAVQNVNAIDGQLNQNSVQLSPTSADAIYQTPRRVTDYGGTSVSSATSTPVVTGYTSNVESQTWLQQKQFQQQQQKQQQHQIPGGPPGQVTVGYGFGQQSPQQEVIQRLVAGHQHSAPPQVLQTGNLQQPLSGSNTLQKEITTTVQYNSHDGQGPPTTWSTWSPATQPIVVQDFSNRPRTDEQSSTLTRNGGGGGDVDAVFESTLTKSHQSRQQQQSSGSLPRGGSSGGLLTVTSRTTSSDAARTYADRQRSVSPSDMALRARLQSRLETRSPGLLAQSGGATSPSVYAGNSRTNSLTSLNDGDVLLNSPRFVRDTSKYWHKPHITREDAINLLKDKPAGWFVVRNSNTFQGAFGLALKVAQLPPNIHTKEGVDPQTELVRHFLIEPTSKGVRLKGCSNEPEFGSLAALIYQHTITPLALPCKLVLPEVDIAEIDAVDASTTGTLVKTQLYQQGAACNVLYIGSVDMESLTGPEALSRAISKIFPSGSQAAPPSTTVVHFKVSSQGITLTDNKHRLFFRRHYPVNTVTFCGVDTKDRRWTLKLDDNQTIDCKVFGFVARKPNSNSENACHVFGEMDPNQPANAIVNFLTKVMIGQGHFMKT